MFHPLGGKLRIQPDDDGISDKTVGVENPVKTVDVFHGFRRIFSDMDEMKIVCGNQSGIHQFIKDRRIFQIRRNPPVPRE